MIRRLVLLCILLQITTAEDVKNGRPMMNGGNQKNLADIGGRYYYFGTVMRVDIHTAQAFCEDFSMNLLALESDEEKMNVSNYIRDQLGQAEEFWWTSGVRHNEGWLWTGSGSIMKYFDWDDNEPDPPAYPAQSCVWIKNGRLGDYPCDFENYFVCEEKPRC